MVTNTTLADLKTLVWCNGQIINGCEVLQGEGGSKRKQHENQQFLHFLSFVLGNEKVTEYLLSGTAVGNQLLF